jgi:hypothetical protein
MKSRYDAAEQDLAQLAIEAHGGLKALGYSVRPFHGQKPAATINHQLLTIDY